MTIHTGRRGDALGTAKQGQHFAQRRQGFAAPIIAYKAKQAMLDWIPFGGATRIVTNGDGEVVWVCQLVL